MNSSCPEPDIPLSKQTRNDPPRGRRKLTAVEFIGVIAITSLLGMMCILPFGGPAFIFEIPLRVMFGWALFLWHTVPRVSVVWSDVAMAAVFFVAFGTGLHGFFLWLSREIATKRGEPAAPWPPRRTFSLVGLIVLIFASGIAAVGITHESVWMARMQESWLNADSQATIRARSRHNVHAIGIGFHNFRDEQGFFPAGAVLDADGIPLHGWGTLILPHIEQGPIYNQIDLRRAWNDPKNRPAFSTIVSMYVNPGFWRTIGPQNSEHNAEGIALSHYAANQHVVSSRPGMKMEDIRDGAANTILAGEVAASFRPWGHPLNWRDPSKGINKSADGFGGPWESGAHLMMVDGSVRFLSNDIDPSVLRALSTPAAGDVINDSPGAAGR